MLVIALSGTGNVAATCEDVEAEVSCRDRLDPSTGHTSAWHRSTVAFQAGAWFYREPHRTVSGLSCWAEMGMRASGLTKRPKKITYLEGKLWKLAHAKTCQHGHAGRRSVSRILGLCCGVLHGDVQGRGQDFSSRADAGNRTKRDRKCCRDLRRRRGGG
jgi:hypothetical protein